MERLSGKVAVITGAGSGVGRACMVAFAREGARVLGVGRTQQKLDETASEVTEAGRDCTVLAEDLSDEFAADRVMKAAVHSFGRLDIVINAASVGYSWANVSPHSIAGASERCLN